MQRVRLISKDQQGSKWGYRIETKSELDQMITVCAVPFLGGITQHSETVIILTTEQVSHVGMGTYYLVYDLRDKKPDTISVVKVFSSQYPQGGYPSEIVKSPMSVLSWKQSEIDKSRLASTVEILNALWQLRNDIIIRRMSKTENGVLPTV